MTTAMRRLDGDGRAAQDEREARRAASDRRDEIQRRINEGLAIIFGDELPKVERHILALLSIGLPDVQVRRSLLGWAESNWWRVERLARTMVAFAFNSARADAIAIMNRRSPVRARWTELVDDDTGEPLDDRVGVDSVVLHGQVASPDGWFTMPADSRLTADWWGMRWKHPPNRPNDRCVLVPWRPGWGVPAWAYDGGGRHVLA